MSTINENLHTCPINFTIDLISGKWSLWILWTLQDNPLRFGEIRNKIPGITEKMLIQQLKKFENYNIVSRKAYLQVPPKVEYSLTEHGRSLKPIMSLIKQWAMNIYIFKKVSKLNKWLF